MDKFKGRDDNEFQIFCCTFLKKLYRYDDNEKIY